MLGGCGDGKHEDSGEGRSDKVAHSRSVSKVMGC
jgi:hypothetical protein